MPWYPAKNAEFRGARFVFLRVLGLVYLTAFLCLANDVLPLIGKGGLLPADSYLEWVHERLGGSWEAAMEMPSVFHFWLSDSLLQGLSWVGVGLSIALVLGFGNGVLLLALWGLYFSFVSIGQRWFSFGWESQLLETGLLAVFLVPFLNPRPFPKKGPSKIVIYLSWWLIFRIMLGAGLIKLRGDPCWTELTCLDYHFQTQPVPGPFSRIFHNMPPSVLHFGVFFNHLTELIAPFFLLGTRRIRHGAAIVMLLFQFTLILSGNLAFLNWLTILPCLLCIDDSLWSKVLPAHWMKKSDEREGEEKEREAEEEHMGRESGQFRFNWRMSPIYLYALVVCWLSLPVVKNLMSKDQAMNTSFQSLRIVNTYGAFGSVGSDRYEIIIEGAHYVKGSEPEWREYEFKCKPGSLDRRPCWISPYHYRLDWLAWFAGIEAGSGSALRREAWLAHLMWKLMDNDYLALSLLDGNPFPEKAPTLMRVQLYVYEFADSSTGNWWERKLEGTWIGPVGKGNENFEAFLRRRGWIE